MQVLVADRVPAYHDGVHRHLVARRRTPATGRPSEPVIAKASSRGLARDERGGPRDQGVAGRGGGQALGVGVAGLVGVVTGPGGLRMAGRGRRSGCRPAWSRTRRGGRWRPRCSRPRRRRAPARPRSPPAAPPSSWHPLVGDVLGRPRRYRQKIPCGGMSWFPRRPTPGPGRPPRCASAHADWRSKRFPGDPRSVSTAASSPVRPFAFRRTAPSSAPTGVPLAEAASLPERDPHRRPWPGRQLTSGGVTLHVRETPGPDGAPAVYVHGLSGSATNWTDLAGLLRTRAAGIAVDLPGFGESRPLASRDFTPAGHADALLCFLAGAGPPGAPAGQLAGWGGRAQRGRPPARAGAHA